MWTISKDETVWRRLVPHFAVLNSQNRKLWTTLHGILAANDGFLQRTRYEDGTIVHEPKPVVWWNVTLRHEEAPHIEFYAGLPASLLEVVDIKIKNHNQWSRVQLEEADLPLPPAASLYRLKLSRANMFSLDHDYTEQTTPIRDLLRISDELREGDYLGLFYRLEAQGRRRWKDRADYEWSVWSNGGVPQRSNLDPQKLFKSGARLIGAMADQIRGITDDVMIGLERTFFAEQKYARAQGTQLVDPEQAELLVNGELSYRTRQKRNLPAYRVDIYTVIYAGTEARQEMLAHSVEAAFQDLRGDNELRIESAGKLHTITPEALPVDHDKCILSVDELGKLIQLPTSDLQQEFSEALVANRQVEVELPAVFRDESGIYMGTTTDRGETLEVYLPTSNRDMLMTSRAYLGSPRMGKDQAVVNLVVESALNHGIGAVIPDVIDERHGHRGMSDAIRDHLPPEQVIDLDLGNFDYPVYVGPQLVQNLGNERIAASRLAQELTAFLMGDDWTNYQTREYLREFTKAAKGDLLSLRLLFTSADYREQAISRLEDCPLLEEYHALCASSPGRAGQIYGPIAVRLGELWGDEALRPIFTQRPNPRLDLARWLREGKVIIYRVPSRIIGEQSAKVLVHWIVLSVFLTKLAGGIETPCWLVLNEPHQFLTPGLSQLVKRILAEGPKLRLAAIPIFHTFSQLPNDFTEMLLSSTLSWHILKNTNDHVYHRLLPYLQPTFPNASIAMSATKRFEAIAAWIQPSGEYGTPFLYRLPDLVGKRHKTYDNVWLTKQHSRTFGRRIEDVERERRARETQKAPSL